jgi:hypothetical protein
MMKNVQQQLDFLFFICKYVLSGSMSKRVRAKMAAKQKPGNNTVQSARLQQQAHAAQECLGIQPQFSLRSHIISA